MKFVVYQDSAGRWRWRLKTANGRIVADSGYSYSSQVRADLAADAVITGIRQAEYRPEIVCTRRPQP